eukprot:1287510-Rhodomonas_salina.1
MSGTDTAYGAPSLSEPGCIPRIVLRFPHAMPGTDAGSYASAMRCPVLTSAVCYAYAMRCQCPVLTQLGVCCTEHSPAPSSSARSTPLSAYARAMRRLVLTPRMVLPGIAAADYVLAFGQYKGRTLGETPGPLCYAQSALRTAYAISGTDGGYAATRSYLTWLVDKRVYMSHPQASASEPRARYGMSGTDYARSVPPGTDNMRGGTSSR